ncbi:MAG: ACT domain-containing protein, partial [Mesorhizobium sp.]
MEKSYLLTLQCKNRPGIVAGVASRLAAHGANITAAQQFDDSETDRFFMRVAFDLPSPLDDLAGRFSEEVNRFGLQWTLRPQNLPRKVLLLVSKFDHCLVDLLYRQRLGELPMQVVAIVSNHPREGLN